jgi:nitrite reductase/ring-hydroxylating ferredoxin subunit
MGYSGHQDKITSSNLFRSGGNMSELVQVGTVNELAPGTMKEVMVGQIPVLVARVGVEYYAVQGRCTHMGGVLARGRLDGNVVTCPRHGSQFTVTDGKVVRWMKGRGFMAYIGKILKPPRGLKTYPVNIQDGNVFIRI